MIWIFNANQWKYPSLRAFRRVNKHGDPNFFFFFSFFFIFFKVHIMNVDYFKFQKSLIVEQ